MSEALRLVDKVSAPDFAMPQQACDAHMHVFGPIDRYPSSPNAKYAKPEGTLEQYQAVAGRLGLHRMVLVQASFYGADNRCILDAMAVVGDQARGVVFLPIDASPALLDDFHARGVRGLRIDLFKADREGATLADVRGQIAWLTGIARQFGWHLEFYAPGLWISRLLPDLAALDVDFSINHMGYMTAEEGLVEEDFRRLLDLARSERCWVKLTGPYRVAGGGDQARPDWMARELVATAPERLIWGTDWPHISHGGQDAGALLSRLARWCPDAATRQRILVDNPARLYDYA